MIGATFCSGIGAPEMAAKDLFEPIFFSEIEPFPCAVLSHHWPGVPNIGDMTASDLVGRIAAIGLPDIIVAGLPCQPFSVAGLRKGEKDSRNLTTIFIEVSHAINDLRRAAGKPALCALVENVPGLLSDRGNAFGCFLGGLVGAMDAIVPSPCPKRGKSSEHWKWHKGGRTEVLDDEGEPTGEFVTVEPHHRLTWPGEGMVQGPRARAAWAVLDAQWFGVAQRRRRVFVVIDFGNSVDPAAVLLEPDRLRGDTPPRRETGAPVAALTSNGVGTCGADDNQGQAGHLIASTGNVPHCLNAGGMGRQDYETETMIAHTLTGEGFDASEDGSGRGTPIVPVSFQSVDHGADASFNLSPTLRRHDPMAVAIQEREVSENLNAGPQGKGRQEGVGYTLEARHHVQAVAFDMRGRDGGAMPEGPHDTANIRAASGGSSRSYIAQPWAVRRLTPRECARLQGFPDDHTAITYRGKPAADGPQYKAYGNSMAVPCIKWILDRMRISMEAAE